MPNTLDAAGRTARGERGGLFGVPANLDLSPFQGASLVQVCLGEFQMQLHFRLDDQPLLEVSIEGDWELRGVDDELVDAGSPRPIGEGCELHAMLGRVITSTSVSAPRSFALRFESGHDLHVYDSSDEYETISIQPLGVII